MARTSKSNNNHEEEEEEEDAAGTDTSSHREGKKPSNYRSKHSETEQRRRSKINERFQILKDLIPPNGQKRDKASLLLEVIEYVQFLQEKLQVYEGSYQQEVWAQDPTKLIPWQRPNHGPVDNFGHHTQAMKNGSLDDSNLIQPMTSTQGPLAEFSSDCFYREDHPAGPAALAAINYNIPVQPSAYPSGRRILRTENISSQPHGSTIPECRVIGKEGKASESNTSSLSDVYSQGLLRKLTQALQTSGVDLSQANISVQLDVAKRDNSGSIPIASSVGNFDANQLQSNLLGSHMDAISKENEQATKRYKIGES